VPPSFVELAPETKPNVKVRVVEQRALSRHLRQLCHALRECELQGKKVFGEDHSESTRYERLPSARSLGQLSQRSWGDCQIAFN
jgi:hypothetical protein